MGRTVGSEAVQAIIQAYIENDENITQASQALGVHRQTVSKYVQEWQSGKHASIPPQVKKEAEGGQSMYRRQYQALKAERDGLLKEKEENARLMGLFKFIHEAKSEVPKWVSARPKISKKQSIATAFLSDVHLDEVVAPEQINFVNEFNREIAEARLKLFFDNTIELAQSYLHGLTYEGLVLPLGGDIFSGIIHEELTETNAGTIFESILYWAEPIAAGIKHLRDAFGRIFLPCVAGNHGRRRYKPHAKHRAQDNFDWFFYHLLAKLLKGEKGIDFAISEAADQPYAVFDTKYLLTHGDQFRGGSGIAGMLSPLMIGDSRKRQRETAVRRPYDYLIMGHWHQLAFIRGLVINGSLKGYDEYAYVSNFAYEPPQQAFWITDPVYGMTIKAPIHVARNEEYASETGGKSVVQALR